MVRADGGSAANDMITMGTHVGTHIDALSHVSQDGKLYGGIGRRRGAAAAGGTPSWARTPSRRWCAAACCSTSRPSRASTRLRAGYEITVADLEAAAARQGTAIAPGDVVLIRSGWGQHFDAERPEPVHRAQSPACRASARGRALAGGPGRPRRRRGHHRVRVPARPAPGTAPCRRTGCCWSSTASTSSRRWRWSELAADGGARVPLRAVAAALLRRHRLAGAPAGGGRQWLTSRPSAPAARRVRRPQRHRRRARRGRRQRPPAGAGHRSALCVAAHRLPTSAAARATSPTRAAPAGPHRRRARPGARRAGRLRQRGAGALAGLRRHPPAVGAAPQRVRGPGRPGRRRARRRRRRADRTRHRGRPGGHRPARHGRLRPRAGQLGLLRARPARHLDLRRDGRRGRRRRCCSASTPSGILDALGVAASMAAGIIEANRTGGTVKRLHCGWAAQSAVTAAELVQHGLHRAADSPGGAVRLLRGVAARQASPPRRSPAASGSEWAVPGIFFKPYPANHFTHAAIDAGLALRARGVAPESVDAHHPRRARRGHPDHRPADRDQARAGHRLPGAVQRPVRGRRRPARRRRPRRRAGRLHRRAGARTRSGGR